MTTQEPAAAAPAQTFGRADFGSKARRFGKVILEDGRIVYFQSLRASELTQWETEYLDASGEFSAELLKLQTPKLLARVLVDETGARLFGDNEYQAIAETDSLVIGPISHAVRKHLGLDRKIDDSKKS